MLTFEGAPIQGIAAIIEKLTVNISFALPPIFNLSSLATQSLPFQKVQHKVTTLDAQPSSPSVASLILNVTGLLVVSTEHSGPLGPLYLRWYSSPVVRLGRRQHEPIAVLSGVPAYPRRWELLRVRICSLHHNRETDMRGLLFYLTQSKRHFPSQLWCLIRW